MTKRQWKKYICAALATTLRSDVDELGAGYLFDEMEDSADEDRMRDTAWEIILELDRRGNQLGPERRRG